MNGLNDITNRKDIELLVNSFYDRIKKDDLIGVIFKEVVNENWDRHIKVLTDFWDTVLLDADLYHKNAMEPHIEINRKTPLLEEHFERWLTLFFNTVDENFAGPVAALAKTRAKGIAGIMQLKLVTTGNKSL